MSEKSEFKYDPTSFTRTIGRFERIGYCIVEYPRIDYLLDKNKVIHYFMTLCKNIKIRYNTNIIEEKTIYANLGAFLNSHFKSEETSLGEPHKISPDHIYMYIDDIDKTTRIVKIVFLERKFELSETFKEGESVINSVSDYLKNFKRDVCFNIVENVELKKSLEDEIRQKNDLAAKYENLKKEFEDLTSEYRNQTDKYNELRQLIDSIKNFF